MAATLLRFAAAFAAFHAAADAAAFLIFQRYAITPLFSLRRHC